MTHELRIAICCDLMYEKNRDTVRGLTRDPARRQRWHLQLFDNRTDALGAVHRWQPHGIIAQVNDAGFATALRRCGPPVVNISNTIRPRLPQVHVDDEAVGRIACEHLLGRGCRSLAFAGYGGSYAFARGRWRGFASAARAAGHRPRRFATPSPAELAALPLGSGIFTTGDRLAYEVLRRCHSAGRRVPEEIAVIGAGDDELLCACAAPTLSTVPLSGEAIGDAAAGLLEELIADSRRRGGEILIPPGPVTARQSTDLIACADPCVAAALRFLRAHGHEPIGVDDVVRRVPIGRRRMEQRFRSELGRSIHHELRHVRLEHARSLLVGTALPVAEVAHRSGIARAEHLAQLFRRFDDCTPSEYRERHAR